MSKFISATSLQPPRRLFVIVAGLGASFLLYSWLTRKRKAPTRRLSSTYASTATLLKTITGYEGLVSALAGLEKMLNSLESSRFQSDRDRDRYDLIYSVLARLRGVIADLQKYERNDFDVRPATDEIARKLWNEAPSPKPGTLSVLSDDSFISAHDEFFAQIQDVNAQSVDPEAANFYRQGLEKANNDEIRYRKSRVEICGCESEQDFAAKLWCLRQAFDKILEDQSNRKWLVSLGRSVIADLLRQDKKDPRSFYVAFDRLIDYVEKVEHRGQIENELKARMVDHVNVWDVLIDFVLLDSFEDLRKPPSGISALVKNPFLSKSMRESTLNNLIWSLIKVKRGRLQDRDGFVSHFYDVSQIISPPLTMGLLGGAGQDYQELCNDFKENVLALVADLFNPAKLRFTTLDELAEDVRKTMVVRLELMQVKLRHELPPA